MLGNKSFREKIISNYEMYSTCFEISGDLLEGNQYKNNDGDFIEWFEIKIYNNVFVKYVAAFVKGEFKSWAEVKLVTDDKKQFKASIYENDKTIAVPKAASGYYLTAFGLKMYGAYVLWGRTLIRGYDCLSSEIEDVRNKDLRLIEILQEEDLYPLDQEARKNWNKLFDDAKYAEGYWSKILRENAK